MSIKLLEDYWILAKSKLGRYPTIGAFKSLQADFHPKK